MREVLKMRLFGGYSHLQPHHTEGSSYVLNHHLLAALVPLSKTREAVLQVPGAHANMSPMPNQEAMPGAAGGRMDPRGQ